MPRVFVLLQPIAANAFTRLVLRCAPKTFFRTRNVLAGFSHTRIHQYKLETESRALCVEGRDWKVRCVALVEGSFAVRPKHMNNVYVDACCTAFVRSERITYSVRN